MTLAAGSKLGPYEILAPIGAGGMGEVYRARDPRLGREVAIKVLPGSLTDSESARVRFERESRTISQLSHPHICAIFDVGREGRTEYLVMELLDGQTLASRLARGPLPLDQALRFGSQIADALEKAHRQGIVHRDLKPGNVMLTSSGAKVLDFGLAKALASVPAERLTGLPTETPLTETGTVLGTTQYMAPEQLEGKEADARTDIFALGLVLYEMVTGKTAFSGATRASLIGAILRDDPPPISRSDPVAPRALDRVVATCLAKEPEERWQTARDVAIQLEGIRQERSAPETAAPVVRPRRRAGTLLPWLVAAAAVALAAWALARSARTVPERLIRTLLLPPPETSFSYGSNSAPAVVSPDETRIVFGTRDEDGVARLWIQNLDAAAAFPLPGTESGHFPFWSPDGRFIGFFARGALKTIEAVPAPSPARILAADVVEARGGTWNEEGTILYTAGNLQAIVRVPAAGGKSEPATRLEGDETSHRWPRFLPGGRRFTYEARKPGSGPGAAMLASRDTYLASLDGPGRRRILSEDTSAAYVEPGYLVFGRGPNLVAAPCDPKTLELRGEPSMLAANVESFTAPGAPFFSASESLLVFSQRAGRGRAQIAWLDRSGKETSTLGPAADYLAFGLSPDGRTVVASRGEEPLPPDLWTVESASGRGIRITRDSVPQLRPVIVGGGRVLFSAFSRGPWDLWEIPEAGGTPKVFLESEWTKSANDVSPDGRYLIYREFNPATLGDLKVVALALDGDPKPRVFIGSADDETNADFSPDGRRVAYTSDESGRKEVYVASFPEGAGRVRVTSEGGAQPRWSRDGKELYYIRSGQLYAIPVQLDGGSPTFGQGRALFPLSLFSYGDSGFDAVTRYDVAPDGRFVALLREREVAREPLIVIQNWTRMLREKP